MTNTFELPFTEIETDGDAVSLIAAKTPLSKTQIKDAMSKGAVWLERKGKQRRLRRAKSTLTTEDKVAIFFDKKVLDEEPPEPLLIDDRKLFSVWSKPAGLLSGGSRFGDHCAIDRVIEKQLDRQTFLIHRLDRFAWGLMVFAHNKRTAAAISHQFQTRTVEKTYNAIVHGGLNEATTVESTIDGKPAVSHITPMTSTGDQTLVSINIETGRKHQIRIHLSELGHPIRGDRQYGSNEKVDMQLAAVELVFTEPATGDRLSYSLPEAEHPNI